MVTEQAQRNRRIEDVASGQRLVILSILVNVIAAVGSMNGDPVWRLVLIGSGLVALFGLLRLSSGLGYSTGKRIGLIIAAFIPLVSLIMLVIVNQRANEALKASGYSVGLLGARKA